MNDYDRIRDYNAAVNYNKGYDLQQKGDIDAAVEAYQIAAKFGATDAMSRLGTIYDDLKNPKNEKLALLWYKRGVRAGDPGCAWNIAMHYAGIGNRRCYINWLNFADRMGYAEASIEISNGYWWKKRNSK